MKIIPKKVTKRIKRTQYVQKNVVTQKGENVPIGELQPGDVLIHHSHKPGSWDAIPFHCSIIGPNPEESEEIFSQLETYDSLPKTEIGGGVRSKSVYQITDSCAVFRLRPTGEEASEISEKAAKQAELIQEAKTGYGNKIGRAALSAVGRKKFSTSAEKRLKKYYERNTKSPKNVFCSELVVICYQMAVMEEALKEYKSVKIEKCKENPLFIKLDAKFTTPWNLEEYFLKHHDDWELKGSIN